MNGPLNTEPFWSTSNYENPCLFLCSQYFKYACFHIKDINIDKAAQWNNIADEVVARDNFSSTNFRSVDLWAGKAGGSQEKLWIKIIIAW